MHTESVHRGVAPWGLELRGGRSEGQLALVSGAEDGREGAGGPAPDLGLAIVPVLLDPLLSSLVRNGPAGPPASSNTLLRPSVAGYPTVGAEDDLLLFASCTRAEISVHSGGPPASGHPREGARPVVRDLRSSQRGRTVTPKGSL